MIGTCERCGAKGVAGETHHMIPRGRGGHDGPTAFLCCKCHRAVTDHGVEDWKDWLLKPGGKKKKPDVQF